MSAFFCARRSLPRALALLPLAAGLAAAAAIQQTTGLTIDLRWPNDLLAGPRKLGGILVEARTESALSSPHAVVGIGINIHHRAFPADLATPATSHRPRNRQAQSPASPCLIALLQSLEAETTALENPNAPQTLPQRLQQASTWINGRAVHVHGPQACTGITAGLDANGFLLVRTAEGLVTVQTGGLRAAANEANDLL